MRRIVFLLSLLYAFSSLVLSQRVSIGAELLMQSYLDSLKGKRVGVICNHTSVLPNGVHIVDTLLHSGIKVTMLFAPEHGIRGTISAGTKVANQTDSATGLPIYSLYGGTRKPTEEMLQQIDILVFDMQDVGARFYTYASTMAYVMEAAAENGKKFIVLDRPNPINGNDIEGPVLDLRLISFIGLFPIPVRHGLTLGELAKMVVGEGYINPSNVDLMVVPMQGWKRSMWYDDTGLPWVSPSPNMKSLSTATVYPGTCLFEATNITEARGTTKPFEYIGAPGLNNERLALKLNAMGLPGVRFEPVEFTPKVDSIAAPDPKFKNKKCSGVFVHVKNRKTFKPVLTGLMILEMVRGMYPRKFQLKQGLFDHYIGDTSVGEKLLKGEIGKNILDPFKTELREYDRLRAKYFLY
ncbi:MAG: DUF1343 domain-containing protein [Ignavibacteria bacterium]|nr:DUF1343 domain-containing protein [Ignavibacteria bacterium]